MKSIRYIVVFLLLIAFFSTRAFASSALFSENFIDIDGTKLSNHDSRWSFVDFEPSNPGRWGEYEIVNNSAGDGEGEVFNSAKLDYSLPNHFLVTINFLYQFEMPGDPHNQHFIDLRFYNGTESNLIRFWTISNTTNLDVYADTYHTSNLGFYNQSGANAVSVEYSQNTYVVKINSSTVLTFNDSLVPGYLIIDQPVDTALLTKLEISDPDLSPSPLPSSSPTPTPTVSPSATPSPSPTLITAFSQRDPNWKEETYDSANLWSSSNPTIESWGCALTSASTVLDYYGIHELPGGVPNNPKNLNDWLNNESDGYIRKGAINWNAISRVSKLLSSPDGTPALEYAYKGNDSQYLHERLSASQPVILEEPGHFITAYRYDEGTNTTDIVDPYWTTGTGAKTTLASYADTFKSMRTFSPSHTNLGYLMGISDSEINMKLLMKNGPLFEEISTAAVYTQEPFVEQSSGNTANASPFNALEYPKPEAGNYQMSFSRSAPGYGRSEIYIYDSQGNPEVIPLLNLFGTNNILFNIQYDPEGSSAMIQKVATFDLLRQDLLTGRSLGEFKKNYRGQDLLEILEAASRVYPKWKKPSLTLMSVFTRLLPYRRRLMSAELYETLMSDAELLITQLY